MQIRNAPASQFPRLKSYLELGKKKKKVFKSFLKTRSFLNANCYQITCRPYVFLFSLKQRMKQNEEDNERDKVNTSDGLKMYAVVSESSQKTENFRHFVNSLSFLLVKRKN